MFSHNAEMYLLYLLNTENLTDKTGQFSDYGFSKHVFSQRQEEIKNEKNTLWRLSTAETLGWEHCEFAKNY